MDAKEVIARRIALELKDGNLVNLGIGLPTMVASFLPAGVDVFFQAENGLIGMEPLPEPGLVDEYLADPGGSFIGAVPGACSFDSCFSFGLIRGGHLDVTVLGGLEVDERGLLANWTIPGKMVPGMGGAMDLVTGSRSVIVAMTHTAKGKSKILKQCTLPLTSLRPVSLVVTELAVIEPTPRGLVLKELAPGVTVDEVVAATEATLLIPPQLPTMQIAAPA
jgi:acetate CoA/acetoacetate CoA-transferase beta subunit